MTQVKNVLVLDDEHDAADLLAEVITSYLPEVTVDVVYTGEDAVVRGTGRPLTAAIFDLEMAGLGGEGAALALRAAHSQNRPLLIALSGNLLRLAALRNSGPFDYLLSKPVDVGSLIDLLTRRLREYG